MASIPMERGTAQWSSRFAFIMAAVGSSVGLGNLWRFSAELGTNGGAAFLLIYLACIVFVGIPVLMSEYMIGRAGNAASAVRSNDDLAEYGGVLPDCIILLRRGGLGAGLYSEIRLRRIRRHERRGRDSCLGRYCRQNR